jgi:hypothetical protein
MQSLVTAKKNCERRVSGPNKEIALIEAIDENPHIGQKSLARELQNKPVICLVQFCQFIQQKLNEIVNFLDYILFSDEARFSNNGAANRHNCHYL